MADLPKLGKETTALLQRTLAEETTPADLRQLHRLFADRPELYRNLFGLAAQTERELITTMFNPALTRVAVEHELADLRISLGCADAPPLERLLLEHIVLCWLRYQWTEYASAQAGDNLEYWERRLAAAQRRYLRAIETLARVRKLGVTVQINVGRNQVNVGS